MGSDNDVSSSAAQSAQEGLSDAATRRPGLFERLTGALSPSRISNGLVGAEVTQLPHVSTPGVGLVNLHAMRVEDVAIPRAEIVSVPVDIELNDLIKVFRESGLTRVPVFQDTLDTPIGLIHLKDLALLHGFIAEGADRPEFDLNCLVREVIFVPPSMPIGVLLQKMQSSRKHMALVIDEYGGVDGLVTIEDLIEQVIGEIEDEHDIEEVENFKLEKTGVYIAQSRTPLDDFEAEIGLRLSDNEMDDEIDTLGGLVFMLTGRVPSRGEVVKHPNGAEFEIVDADPRRIKRIRFRMPGQPAE